MRTLPMFTVTLGLPVEGLMVSTLFVLVAVELTFSVSSRLSLVFFEPIFFLWTPYFVFFLFILTQLPCFSVFLRLLSRVRPTGEMADPAGRFPDGHFFGYSPGLHNFVHCFPDYHRLCIRLSYVPSFGRNNTYLQI